MRSISEEHFAEQGHLRSISEEHSAEQDSPYILNYKLCNQNLPTNCSIGTIGVYRVNNCYDPYNKTANNAVVSNSNVLNNSELIIAPNPSNDAFNIVFDTPLIGKTILEVYNLVGQKVYVETIENKKEHQLLLSHLPVGSYILKIINNNKYIDKKLLKN